jgi:hypothetical protein
VNPKYHAEYLEKYYYSNYPIDILESSNKTIPPSPILDFAYLETIPENPRLFLARIIGIEMSCTNDLPAEQISQISIRNG